MKIRHAKIEDCEKIHKMCRIPQLADPSGEPSQLWWIKSFVNERQIFLIAEEKKEIIGFILGERTCGDIGYFWMLAIKPEFQGKGISKKLLKKAEEECIERKIKVIVLYADEKSPRVLRLVENFSYEKGRKYWEFVKFLDYQ